MSASEKENTEPYRRHKATKKNRLHPMPFIKVLNSGLPFF
jgi:hypothetical protein